MKTIQQLFEEITSSNLCRLDGPEIDLCQVTQDLCQAITGTEHDEFIWDLGECGEFTLGDFLVGAYWAFHEWSGGQTSETYATGCAVGTIYRPGMTDGPQADSGEESAYDAVNEYFKK